VKVNAEQILADFRLFVLGTDGIGGWLGPDTDSRVFDRLALVDTDPLTKVQLSQLLAFGHEAPVSDDFFRYYWLSDPSRHPYDVKTLPEFDQKWPTSTAIMSLGHLRWGLHRLYVDGLLFFGNVRTAYRKLRALTNQELDGFYGKRRFDTEAIKGRGPALPLTAIPKDDRYLISEMACKSYGDAGEGTALSRRPSSERSRLTLAGAAAQSRSDTYWIPDCWLRNTPVANTN
jgi:hypothetical protein